MTNRNPISVVRQTGVSMIETMLVMPIMLVIGLGIIHGGLVFQAQSNLEYAALMAARAGAANNIDIEAMVVEAEYRMRATTGVSAENQDDIDGALGRFNIEVLNPTQGMFNDCGLPPATPGVCNGSLICQELPFFGLQFYDHNDLRCDGANIQDANLLRVRLTYLYDSKVPLLNNIRFIGESSLPEAIAGTPITAVATVRMQSPARLTEFNQPYIYSD
ncbi:MAG: TadE family protein [Pseudomonadota bacterium]|nr:TadE family protein [Pseudomonadota bacterium]